MGTGIILSMAMKNKNPPQNAQTLSRPTMDEDGRSDSGLVGIACPATPAAVPAGPHVALRFSLPMLAACALAQDCRSIETPAGWRLLVMCTDGKKRPVRADEVQAHDFVTQTDTSATPIK